MNSFLKLITIIFTIYAVRCRETARNSKSVNEKIIYDCVDIYKQPSLTHPLLQNHKIQMEPSFIISKQKDQTKTKSESKKFIDCPNGTVPILKNTKEFVTNAQYWANKHFNSFTIDSHGTHFAGVRASQDQGPYHGVEAWMSVHELNISVDQTSYTNIYVASAVSDKVNFIQTGWMVNPTLFGDGRPWSYGLWKGINRTGCYNTICPGFIQVSKTDPLSIPLSPLPKGEIGTYLSIKQDEETGNWWAADVKYNGHGMNIGYWPKELFDLISTNAGMVGVTGAVQASPSGKSPPMGNGYLPTKSEMGSARVRDANIIDSNFKVIGSKKYKLEKILDSDKCYGLRDGRKKSFDEGTYVLFTYGGPGGDSCGV
ncbi:hypothetical protein YC2023_013760 [Brassica napus]|uniref:uncharacterized protein LOC106326380 n=1 Tax=Brassica oleracea var. oleracea TaxID=109376 RepID=UPI0006A71CE1|nr:PREDICTED: uncharacterized protein LOC106326380 [Brassica oleracea var. oleracea]